MKMPTLSAGQNKAHSGFTLLELLIVVAIMGVMGTLAYPLVRPSKYDGRIAANSLLRQLENLRDEAAKQGAPLLLEQAFVRDPWLVWQLPKTSESDALEDLHVNLPEGLKIKELISPLGRQELIAFTAYPDATTDPYVIVLEEQTTKDRWRLTFNGTIQTGRVEKEAHD